MNCPKSVREESVSSILFQANLIINNTRGGISSVPEEKGNEFLFILHA